MAGQRPGTPKGPGADAGGPDEGSGERKQYTVRRGDTLWGIAQSTLKGGQHESEIYGLNKPGTPGGADITDENKIYPGETLAMPADASGPGVQTVPGTGGGSNGKGNSGGGRAGNGGAAGTAAGDKVTVDLAGAGLAAQSLEALRTALDANVPMLQKAVSQLNAHGASLQLPGQLQQLRGRAPSDAGDMRAAYQIAEHLNNQLPPARPINTYGSINIGVGWDPGALAVAAAKIDAQNLTAALASKDTGTARAAILDVASDLSDHQGDTSYLTAFWSGKGVAQAGANLAGVLNRQDGGIHQLSAADQKAFATGGTLSPQGQKFFQNGRGADLLSAQDQQILATFGNSLAAATKAGKLEPAAAQQLVAAFAKPADLWSAGMLIKYGPKGDAYGTTTDGTGPRILSGLTEALLNAREHGGYTIPLQSRFASVDPSNHSQMDGDPTKQLARWGPLEPVMQRASQNGTAASQVIDGYNPVTGGTNAQLGINWAQQLMDPPKITYNAPMAPGINAGNGTFTIRALSAYPGGMPVPAGQWGYIGIPDKTAGNFLYAATANRASAGAAQAVLNIMEANAQIANVNIYDSKADLTKTIPVLSKPIRQALVKIAEERVPDFAVTSFTGTPTDTIGVHDVNGVPFALSNQNALELFLREALQDPQDAFAYKGAAEAKMTAAVEMTIQSGQPWLQEMSALVGMTERSIGANNFQGAEAIAAKKAQVEAFANLALSPIMLTPTPAPASLADFALPKVTIPWLTKLGVLTGLNYHTNSISGEDPSTALFQTDQAFVDDKTSAQLMVVQGLVMAGVLKPDPAWYQNGHVINSSSLQTLVHQPATANGPGEEPQEPKYGGHTLTQWVQLARNGMQGQQ